jgi:hypothetical protein
MNKVLFTVALSLITILSSAQFVKLQVEEVDNHGAVEGKTYRLYAVMKAQGDHVHAVYATQGHPLYLRSTAPFFQSVYGGGTSTAINPVLVKEKDELKYDSWVTIKMEDNSQDTTVYTVNLTPDSAVRYSNSLNVMTLELGEFEKGKALEVADGAWFVIPTLPNIGCGPDKRILLMQFTTTGKVTGRLNLQGMTFEGFTWSENDLTFSCGK